MKASVYSVEQTKILILMDFCLDPEHEKHQLDQDTLNAIVTRIVDVADPEKIILFGSAARGEMGPHSDVDLLIVKDGVHRRDLA